MASSNSPCAACKFLRRKCTQECVFAPYFPPDQPQKFANVHKVFGASNVAKMLNELSPAQREDAVNSLAYEAEARLRDPVYGCVGLISLLQHKLKQVHSDLYNARKELSSYIGPSAMLSLAHPQHPMHHLLNPTTGGLGPFVMPQMGLGPTHPSQAQAQMMLREQQQQMLEAQQLAAAVVAREQQEMLRGGYEQQQHELVRYNSGFEGGGGGGGQGFNQMTPTGAASPSSLPLVPFESPFQLQQPEQDQHPHHHQHLQQHHRAGSDEGRGGIGPSS